MWFFKWIREHVKNAVLGGFADAAEELDLADPELRERLKLPPRAVTAVAGALPPAAATAAATVAAEQAAAGGGEPEGEGAEAVTPVKSGRGGRRT
jgi:septal ring-binding cell division protein DamX